MNLKYHLDNLLNHMVSGHKTQMSNTFATETEDVHI